ncbi:aminotransferase class III-fold pyridoxal phosphate-dependent enzyme [Sphingomonas abietis]|uniref:Aminotransferase class III-fold pyridoxal phosphate-dependent enzyme n=1 Tax=Sphingomonas abietis TaxID=3012344 RepID=A0ABY7NN79_9SPHN|nr:aminotransferase class III-fold pyridoxal phosphate-dependent enzyme [Sphingomonas abietis]WBO22042.1 aminotransferase class III-fold pyridoxal phosphate-dependent enzyme [Sphingomonas abietis]
MRMEASIPFAAQPVILSALGLAAVAVGATKGRARLTLSRAKYRSLAGHVRMSLRVARLIPAWRYDEQRFFRADAPLEDVARQREAGFARLADLYATRFAKTAALTKQTAGGLSDLQFTGAYRVPFQFSDMVRRHLSAGSFLERSDGVTITDLDGNRFYDVAGSYGVNLLGFDAYKAMIAQGAAEVADLGPVLGGYHPVVADNVARLTALSGMDEVSFHMSGTEAVMQAVRLARYHTKRSHVVRFCGAYHGWWGDVQPGVGNPVPADRTYTLADMSENTLKVLASRHNIACVLVNPLQALHPNKGAPSDSATVDSSRDAGFDKAAYGAWLERLAETCRKAGIVLIFDEVFVGFRLARGGAAEYFGVKPDMVTYGKTLGGGLPVGVLCGRHDLMKRYRDDRPVDICFARGTFNAHPYVMGAMNAFLRFVDTVEGRGLYDGLDARWNARAAQLNAALAEAGLPVAVANISTIWTVLFRTPSRYNWMLQYYLRAEGLALSWVGTGRLIFSLNYTDADFAEVVARFVRAAEAMQADGWWWHDPAITNKAIRRSILKEMWAARRGRM